jgi:hypothetical protein
LGGKIFHFPNFAREAEIREFLTDQKETPELDVKKNLAITQGNFDAAQIRCLSNGPWDKNTIIAYYYLIINGREQGLFHHELVFLYYMLGRHFGYTDEVLGGRLRAFFESSADE